MHPAILFGNPFKYSLLDPPLLFLFVDVVYLWLSDFDDVVALVWVAHVDVTIGSLLRLLVKRVVDNAESLGQVFRERVGSLRVQRLLVLVVIIVMVVVLNVIVVIMLVIVVKGVIIVVFLFGIVGVLRSSMGVVQLAMEIILPILNLIQRLGIVGMLVIGTISRLPVAPVKVFLLLTPIEPLIGNLSVHVLVLVRTSGCGRPWGSLSASSSSISISTSISISIWPFSLTHPVDIPLLCLV